MTQQNLTVQNRGSRPVAVLTDLPELEATAILYLRLWCHAPEAQAEVWNELVDVFGADRARKELQTFETLVGTMMRNARRPLMRHQLSCQCVGADEAAFANFIGAAGSGEREDAMLLASLMVKPDIAPFVTGLAETFGLCLRQLIRRTAQKSVPSKPAAALLH